MLLCNCSSISDWYSSFFKFYNKLSDNVKNIDNDEILDYDIKKDYHIFILIRILFTN